MPYRQQTSKHHEQDTHHAPKAEVHEPKPKAPAVKVETERDKAIEECAKLVETYPAGPTGNHPPQGVLAQALRSLKSAP
jgi:hypothetical protein